MVHDGSGLRCRYYANRQLGHRGRNPHMRGTTSALRAVLGKGLGANWDEEFIVLGGRRVHIFDAFALVNVLLCAAGSAGSGRGASTRIMRRNCLMYFEATLEILAPTLVLLQGHGVKDAAGKSRGARPAIGSSPSAAQPQPNGDARSEPPRLHAGGTSRSPLGCRGGPPASPPPATRCARA